MPVDIEKTKTIIDIIKSMTSAQMAVTIFLIVSSVLLTIWFERKYSNMIDSLVKIVDYEKDLQRQQQLIDQQKEFVSKQKTEILVIRSQIRTVVNSLPAEIRKEFYTRSTHDKLLGDETIENKPMFPTRPAQ